MSSRFFGWSTPLCGCCADPKTCCYVTWCLPCAYGDIVQRFPQGSMCCAGNRNGAAASFLGLIFADFIFSSLKNQKGAGNFILGTAGQAGAEIAEGFLLSESRRLLRKEFNIPNAKDFWHSDFCLGCFCGSCVVCQELREIKIRDEKKREDITIIKPPKLALDFSSDRNILL